MFLPAMLPDAVLQKLDGLPVQSGVYVFKDRKGAVVYVGKAKSLRSRVRSYFQDSSGDARAFIPILQRTIGDFDTIVTANEKEATILENTLVKEYRPRFNVKLRDDKDFITLRLGKVGEAAPGTEGSSRPPSARELAAGTWPRLEVVRRPTPDGARYFGPYHSATAARRTLHLVNKHFQLRTCSDVEFAGRKRPCLQHQIRRCPAPCVLDVDRAFYREQVDAVGKFLEGRHDELSRELEDKMRSAARETRFELAAVYRDQLRAIEKVREEQRVVTMDDIDRDVVGLYREGEIVELALLHVRAGKLADVTTYSIRQAEIPDEEIVAAFIAQHHGGALVRGGDAEGEGEGAVDSAPVLVLVPDEVILPCEPEGVEGMAEWLSDRAGHKVILIVPKRGHRVDLLAMANDNARHSFVEKRRQSDDLHERLRDLQERLRLAVLPRRIECCDISHLGGGDTVGAIVAVKDGVPDKKHYRTFHVRGDAMPGGSQGRLNDDYGAMYEVLARRFRRAIKAAELPSDVSEPSASPAPYSAPASTPSRGRQRPFSADRAESDGPAIDEEEGVAIPEGRKGRDDEAPDLFVVDGGRGQLAVALAAAHDLGMHDLAIVALAKERETALGEALTDRVYLPGQKNPIPLKSSTTSLFLLARLRDEAHRFSNRARMRRGKKRRMHSPLDDVKGLGPSAKKALLIGIGNLAAIRAADDAALLAVPGVTARHVRALRTAFPQSPPEPAEPSADDSPNAPTAETERQRS
jgi:excinuclease ABC subunit C